MVHSSNIPSEMEVTNWLPGNSMKFLVCDPNSHFGTAILSYNIVNQVAYIQGVFNFRNFSPTTPLKLQTTSQYKL